VKILRDSAECFPFSIPAALNGFFRKISFLPVKLLLFGFSLLPLRVLYVIGTLFYVLLYYVIRYRRRVTNNNLSLCFPEKTAADIRALEKKYYRHLSDIVAESVKGLTISSREIQKRCSLADRTLFDYCSPWELGMGRAWHQCGASATFGGLVPADFQQDL
jgi:hypothetical protein